MEASDGWMRPTHRHYPAWVVWKVLEKLVVLITDELHEKRDASVQNGVLREFVTARFFLVR